MIRATVGQVGIGGILMGATGYGAKGGVVGLRPAACKKPGARLQRKMSGPVE